MSRFLLVSLNIEAILQETTLYLRQRKLGALAKGLGLGDAYDSTIGRIRAQKGDQPRLGMAALMWISHSERPLNVDEVCHALAVEIGSTDIHARNVPSIRTVLSCCQGLAVVDKGSSTVRLIHFSLKEYLSGRADLFDGAHSKIAETCLTYLNFRAIKDLSPTHSRDLRGAPFLNYSSLHWGIHMRKELSDSSRYLALDLLDQYDSHISAQILWKSTGEQYLNSRGPFSALHCVSYFGIAKLVIDLIKTKREDVNQMGSVGLTPLIWAARCGHEEVVKLLLQQKQTQPDMPDTHYGRTALSWAAGSGHEGVVRLLLASRYNDPGCMGCRWGKRPQVMSLLFGKKYVNPDRPDGGGRTPLSRAAENGYDGVVKLLLGREEVSPDNPDSCGLTPLSWAAKSGQAGVVELLLGCEEVSPDKPDDRGQTPLSWAAKNGHGGVVELLLGREDISPHRPDNRGRSPLSWAAWSGHDGVVGLLLKQGDGNPDRPDNCDQTPLALAARNGHGEVVKLLLGRENVNPNWPDNYGQTPLSLAACNGHDGVVKLLLEQGDVRPDRPDNRGHTPLSWAACTGHDGVVKLLLEREDISPDRPDNRGQTPLFWAVQNGHDAVVKLLLEQETVSPRRRDSYNQTPLSWAAQNRRDGVMELLLRREEIIAEKARQWWPNTALARR